MNPSISVIIPVYNVEKYLEKCLDSVLSQTLSPIEVICIDDGSTDLSPEILSRYAAVHDSLRVLRQPNRGLSAARNAGMDAATGRYLLFVDSDDSLAAPDALERLYRQSEERALEMLFFEARASYESDALRLNAKGSADFYTRGHSYPEITNGQQLFMLMDARGEYRSSACLYLLRRDFAAENRLRFIDGICHEDEAFTLEALSLAQRTACSSVCAYDRLWREGSIMTESSQFRRIRGNLLASRALEAFSRERLAGADAKFLRRYTAHARAINLRGYRQYRNLAPDQRRAFIESLARDERPLIARRLRIGRRSYHARGVRLWLKGLLPEQLWTRLKGLR